MQGSRCHEQSQPLTSCGYVREIACSALLGSQCANDSFVPQLSDACTMLLGDILAWGDGGFGPGDEGFGEGVSAIHHHHHHRGIAGRDISGGDRGTVSVIVQGLVEGVGGGAYIR